MTTTKRITTRLTELLNVRVPVILPPMAGAAGGALAAAVTRGGAFAFVAAGASPLPKLKEEVQKARDALKLSPTSPLPFGIGLMAWRIESPYGDPAQASAFLEYMVDSQPAALWFSFGTQLERWVKRVRELELEKKKGRDRTKLFVMVATQKAALEAAKWGVDVVVAQGTDSGGHGPTHEVGLPTLSLLPSIQSAFSTLENPPILLAAGGIVNGAQLVSVLPFASGAAMGTVFLPSPESLYIDAQRDFIVRSEGTDTTRSMNWDYARGTLGWGEGVDGRGLKNITTQGTEKEAGSDEAMQKYDQATKQGDVTRIVTWSGTSVGLVKEKLPAEALVQKIEREALQTLEQLNKVVETI